MSISINHVDRCLQLSMWNEMHKANSSSVLYIFALHSRSFGNSMCMIWAPVCKQTVYCLQKPSKWQSGSEWVTLVFFVLFSLFSLLFKCGTGSNTILFISPKVYPCMGWFKKLQVGFLLAISCYQIPPEGSVFQNTDLNLRFSAMVISWQAFWVISSTAWWLVDRDWFTFQAMHMNF